MIINAGCTDYNSIKIREVSLMLFSILQIIGGVILSLGWIPQIIQIMKTKSVSDLSLKSYLLILLGISLMEAYAISLAVTGVGLAFLITNTMSLCVVLLVIILIVRYQSGK
jgi:MtN3 and saliva related transmembrane protein